MLNKILKIVLPVLVLVGIGLVILKTQKNIERIQPTEVKPFDFGVYVDNLVKTDLVGKPYSEAQDKYRRIYDIIQTEESVVVTDTIGKRQLLPDSLSNSCYGRVFMAYWSIFESEVEGVFNSDWSNKTDRLPDIKAESQFLKGQKGSFRCVDSLTHYMSYVDYYAKAMETVRKAKACTSSTSYNNLVKDAEVYNRYPISKNAVLHKQLSDVPVEAKNHWRDYISDMVTKACYTETLELFLTKKDECDKKISDFGSMPKEEEKLKNHWEKILEDEVNQAVRIMDDAVFIKEYNRLTRAIDDYGHAYFTQLKGLKEKLEGRLLR